MQTLTVQGRIPSKKNSYRISKNGGFFKPKDITDFEQTVSDECMLQRIKYVEGPFVLRLDVEIFGNAAGDIDNMATTILDALQKAGVYENDKECIALEVHKYPARTKEHEKWIAKIAKPI